jgi:hypothetical protein
MLVTKQSLKDWCVENDAHKTVAWIRKVPLGYEVSLALFSFKEPYFFRTFKEAKDCALDPMSQP